MGFKYRVMLFLDRISSERLSIMLAMSWHILILFGINHVVACLWYAIGTSTTEENWVDFYNVADAHYAVQYMYSIHWSLTQFTPASSGLQAQNYHERAFAVVMLMIAMVTFTSILSSITAAMTRLRSLSSEDAVYAFQLRKFLKDNRITAPLSGRVVRYIELAKQMHQQSIKRANYDEVRLLHLLSGPLKVSLRKELFDPVLILHP